MITTHITKHVNNIATSWCGEESPTPYYRGIDAAILSFGKPPPHGFDYRPCEDCLRAARSSIDVILDKEYPVQEEYNVEIHMMTHDMGNEDIINASCTVNSIEIPNVAVSWVDHPSTPVSRTEAVREAAIRKYQELTRVIE